MSMQPLSPSKVLDGDGYLWTAPLASGGGSNFGWISKSSDQSTEFESYHKEIMPFQEVDILAEQKFTDSRFYIFNPQKLAPSKVEDLKAAARKRLQEYLVHAGIITGGCKFFTSHTLLGRQGQGILSKILFIEM